MTGPPRRPRRTNDNRLLAPDLCRGLLLLPVAVVHAPAYLHDRAGTDHDLPADSATLDRVVVGLRTAVMDQRAYPAFAFLLGYGVQQSRDRLLRVGHVPEAVRRLIRRRGAALLLLGSAHAVSLWSGDILGAHGILTLLLADVDDRVPDSWLLLAAGASAMVVGAGGASGFTDTLPSVSTRGAAAAARARIAEWWPSLLLQPHGLAGGALLGVWAARRRIFEEPDRHRPLLRRAAWVGLGTAFLGGLPQALRAACPQTASTLTGQAAARALHAATGYGGIGYVAAAGLATARPELRHRATGPLLNAIAACGERSLSSYLVQSVVLAPALAAWGSGVGARIGVAAATGLAAGTWVGTVLLADVTRRRRRRGPAEQVLRRLVGSPRERSAPQRNSYALEVELRGPDRSGRCSRGCVSTG